MSGPRWQVAGAVCRASNIGLVNFSQVRVGYSPRRVGKRGHATQNNRTREEVTVAQIIAAKNLPPPLEISQLVRLTAGK